MNLSNCIAFLILVSASLSCNNEGSKIAKMQATIDSLQKRLNESYRPGFGEFMSGIQVHHAKLWFAGENKNWPLADFEIHEMKEGLEDIKEFCADREEASSIDMINGPIDSVANAIEQKNETRFKTAFILLTNTCNNCHKVTNHEFNTITIPDSPPLSNQSFQPVQ